MKGLTQLKPKPLNDVFIRSPKKFVSRFFSGNGLGLAKRPKKDLEGNRAPEDTMNASPIGVWLCRKGIKKSLKRPQSPRRKRAYQNRP
jgi:hypothetical protein